MSLHKYCAAQGCRVLLPPQQRHCDRHRRTYAYSTRHWQRIRHMRLALDNHRCTLNLDGCTTTATTVHLNPDCHGNHELATLENTRSACRRCHGLVDAPRANRTR